MPRAKLSIALPPEIWIADVSTAHPEAEFEIVTALAGEDAGIAHLEVTADEITSVLTAIETQPDVTAIELLWTRGTTGRLQVETVSASLLLPLWQAGIPIETPFPIRDGRAKWELTTTTDRLSVLGDSLDEARIEYSIEHVTAPGTPEAARLLTERQREVLTAAYDMGYYAVPREATLTEVARELDVSKAACSDVLHRAESAVIGRFVRDAT
ncbi:MAG: helix-turn-helix domain-containing protein [Haloquadratum sp.]